MSKVKVVFIASNPTGTRPLSLDVEVEKIRARIRAAEYRDSIELDSRWAASPDALLQILLEAQPDVLHFSGHGDDAGSLILTDEGGEATRVSAERLVALFDSLTHKVRVVVLNACSTRPQAKALSGVIDCVVGMKQPITDAAAIAFSASFYRAFGFGQSVQHALDQGKWSLSCRPDSRDGKSDAQGRKMAHDEASPESLPEAETPELHVRDGVDPRTLILVQRPGPLVAAGRAPAGPRDSTDGLGRLHLLPDLPKHHLPREDELSACLEKLLNQKLGTVAITAPQKTATVVRGMGGAGKSVLANAVARDERTRRRFPDGVFWLTVGQDNAGTESKATALQASLASALGSPLSVATVHEGKQHLRSLLADRSCLIILDDVWETVDAQRMDVVEADSPSRILITTREGRIVTDLDADEVRLGKLSPDQAVRLLSDWSGKPVGGDADALKVARECGYLPLALNLCGAMARDGASWADIASGLNHSDLSFLKRTGLDRTYDSVLASIAASVNHLQPSAPETARRYRDLAVFPADESVPESVVAMLWARSTGCPPYQARIDLGTLERKSLLILEGTAPDRRVSLHDLHHDYVKGTHPDLKSAHDQILEAYRGRCPDGWASGPNDGYFFRHLGRHLVGAGRTEELRALLLDSAWLEAKLRATGVVPLIEDYEPFAADEVLRLVQGALRLSAHILSRDPALLWSQLHGRLQGVVTTEDLQRIRRPSPGTPWLRCLTPSLTAPGDPLIRTLDGHTDSVNAVAVAPGGARAVSASDDGTLRVWDLHTGATVRTLAGHADRVYAVTIAPDGARAVSGSSDRTLRVWDLATGATVRTLEGHTDAVTDVALTADGGRAVSASDDGTLRVWDLATGETVRILKGHTGGVNALAVTPDGVRAVSASVDHTLRVWDLASGETVRILEGHSDGVNAVAVTLTPDGTRVVSGSDDKTLRVWDLATGATVYALTGHSYEINAVAVAPGGARAVSASDDGELRLWDLVTGATIRNLAGHSYRVNAVALTPDGARTVSASDDDTLRVWDFAVGQTARAPAAHSDWIRSVAVTPDGMRAVSASDDQTIRVWDLATGARVQELAGHSDWVNAAAVTPDGMRVVSGSDDDTLRVWDLATGETVRELIGHSDSVRAVAVTPDGARAVSGSDDDTLRVWDLATGATVHELTGHTDPVYTVAITPDGARAVSGSADDTLRVWDLDAGKRLRELTGHSGSVNAVAVTPGGTRAVSGSDDDTLRVWDLATGETVRELIGHSDSVRAVAVTPDGARVVSASIDATLRVWELETGRTIARFAADYLIYSCAVSPDGMTFVAGDCGGCLHLLRLENE